MSTESGGQSDKETLAALTDKYGARACTKPTQILARRVDTKENATKAGGGQPSKPQVHDFPLNGTFLKIKNL